MKQTRHPEPSPDMPFCKNLQVITLLKELSFDTIDATAECGLTALGIACLRGHLGTARRRDFWLTHVLLFGKRAKGSIQFQPAEFCHSIFVALSFRGNGKRDVSTMALEVLNIFVPGPDRFCRDGYVLDLTPHLGSQWQIKV